MVVPEWSYADLNCGPLPCHGSALPAELQPRGPPPGRPASAARSGDGNSQRALSGHTSFPPGWSAFLVFTLCSYQFGMHVHPWVVLRRDGRTRTCGTQCWKLLFSPLNYIPMKTENRPLGVTLRAAPGPGLLIVALPSCRPTRRLPITTRGSLDWRESGHARTPLVSLVHCCPESHATRLSLWAALTVTGQRSGRH